MAYQAAGGEGLAMPGQVLRRERGQAGQVWGENRLHCPLALGPG